MNKSVIMAMKSMSFLLLTYYFKFHAVTCNCNLVINLSSPLLLSLAVQRRILWMKFFLMWCVYIISCMYIGLFHFNDCTGNGGIYVSYLIKVASLYYRGIY